MKNWSKSWALIVHSLSVFKAYPSFLVPLLCVWFAYASGILYLKYGFDFASHGMAFDAGVIAVFIFGISFLLLMSSSIILDAIHQIDSGQPDFAKALRKAVRHDLPSIVPVAMLWAVIWMLLTLLAIILNSNNNRSANDALSAESAAKTIADFHGFSFSEAFINALQKGIRMVMFLIVPAIAWENLGAYPAVKKGLAVLRAHLGVFGRGYALTYVASSFIFLPAAIVLMLGTGHHGQPPLVHFNGEVWVALIIYMGLAWSLSVYLEQLFMAQLYLWHMKWQDAVVAAQKTGQPAPDFNAIPQPELLRQSPGLFAEVQS